MISFHNIKAVAKYESILLGRSWFFRIFALLSIIPLGIYNYILINQWRPWIMEAIPTNIPLINMLILNVGQAIIAIFLASDFIKRDQKLDTSEVFFVKAMSNTEYVIGKTWGSFRMFLLLNFVALGISLLHNSVVDHSWIDWSAYLFYFLFISVPTLIFIIGLSYFLMILLKNQAVVFALLLGYVALTIFYIGNELYYVFNYMGFELPIVKSDIVGFPHIVSLIIQRMIYLLLGLGFITLTIVKFNRLPNKNSGRRIVSVVSVFMFAGAIFLIYTHISDVFKVRNKRVEYVALNDKYVSADKIVPESCEITVEQQTKGIKADAVINGYAERSGEEFIFTLNPGLKLIDVTAKDRELSFEREKQIIIVKFAEPLRRRENVSLTFTYEGDVDQNFCYLDVDNKTYEKRESKNGFVIENQYAFSTPDYLMYTPETYWYPRPGTSYAPSDSRWLQSPFQSFNLEVTPRDSLVAISQGIETIEDGRYIFKSENPLQAISLVIGNYEKLSENIDGIDYSLYYYKKHDFFTSVMDSLQDTIPFMISDLKQDLERDRNLTYPFNRLSLVEVPANFSSFSRLWTKAQETVQPEMIFIPERGYAIDAADINWSIRMAQNNQRAGGGGPMGGPGGRGGRGGNQTRTLYDFKYDALNSFFRSFLNQQLRPQWSMAAGGNANISVSDNPYCIFPELFNFRINIYSPELTVANRLVEQYIYPVTGGGRIRRANGISKDEEANLLFRDHSFRELLEDNSALELRNEIIGLKSQELFKPGEMMAGSDEFKQKIFKFIEENSFRNVPFEFMINELAQFCDYPFREDMPYWLDSVYMPSYEISEPVISFVQTKSDEVYESVFKIKNTTGFDGLIEIQVREQQNESFSDFFFIGPYSNIERVIITETQPVVFNINTIISGNIPSTMNFRAGNSIKVNNRPARKEGTYNLREETNNYDIIVDNEDPEFSVSADKPIGFLAYLLLDDSGKSKTKYSGYNFWRPPLRWIMSTDSKYYGKTVRSAHIIKSGNGEGYAMWSVPVENQGQYDLYYWVAGYDELRGNRWVDASYQFFVYNEEEDPEEISLDLRNAQQGWAQLGTFYINEGTFTVKLTDKTKLRTIEADAIKLVKR